MNEQRMKRRKKRKRIKRIILIIEIIIILAFVGVGLMMLVPNAKVKLVKVLVSCAPGRSLIGNVIGDDYEKFIQDTSFDKSSIVKNTDLEIDGDYTNIILFGGDSRSSDLGSNAHGDSMIIMSVNNETGDIKMVSVYRDTYLKYVKDGETYYDKATNALYLAGIESTINMLNENLDLDITDYIIVNFAGLANVVDALDGLTVTITEEERIFINNYLVGTREATGMDTPDVTTIGQVHLTGLQTTAYCRIRDLPYFQEDGTVLNNDFGRTARQRSVLELLLKKAKSAGVSELVDVSKTMFSKNVGDDKFISSSLDFDQILDLMPVALESNIVGSAGYPLEYSPKRIDGVECLVPKGLEYNAGKLHEYLFDDLNYGSTEALKIINDKLIKLTGIKAATN